MKPQIPWLRVFVEGVVIVGSILLALAADAWWDGRQERRQEQVYLNSLLGELVEGRSRLKDLQGDIDDVISRHEALLDQFGEPALAPPDSLILWLSNLSYPARFLPPSATISDLVSSGGIQLIRNDRIRLGIADYQGALRVFQAEADDAWDTWSNRIQPYLAGRVPRVDRLRQGAYPNPVPLGASPFEPLYDEIFADRTFESLIAERWIRFDAIRYHLVDLHALMTTVIDLIGDDLGQGA